ncbi:thioesterase II family protein [Actinokineospora sp. PR83]|uniref:thioesterase II family protein n=1 Tax=Actinokineospora sp. PR83 TaxID=2884908 RepID=UPI0035ABA4C2
MDRPRPSQRPTLVCFHHAGGTASTFRDWRKNAPDDFDIHPVQLPGRESRIAEPRHTDLDTLVESLLPELEPVLASPHVLLDTAWALIAYRLTQRSLELGLCDIDGMHPEFLRRRSPADPPARLRRHPGPPGDDGETGRLERPHRRRVRPHLPPQRPLHGHWGGLRPPRPGLHPHPPPHPGLRRLTCTRPTRLAHRTNSRVPPAAATLQWP